MTDIESQVFTAVKKAIKEQMPNVTIASEYIHAPSSFPFVSIEEADNYQPSQYFDTNLTSVRESVMYEVNVYSNKKEGRKMECKKIESIIEDVLLQMNFRKTSSHPIPNMKDATIYRRVARYTALTDGKFIYRR